MDNICGYNEKISALVEYFKTYGQDKSFNNSIEGILSNGKIGLDMMEDLVNALSYVGLKLPTSIVKRLYPTTFATYFLDNTKQLNEITGEDAYLVTRTNNPKLILEYAKIVKDPTFIKVLEDVFLNWGDLAGIVNFILANDMIDRDRMIDYVKNHFGEEGYNFIIEALKNIEENLADTGDNL